MKIKSCILSVLIIIITPSIIAQQVTTKIDKLTTVATMPAKNIGNEVIHKASQHRNFDVYSNSLNTSIQHKINRLLPHIPLQDKAKIIDVGTGTGCVAALIAINNPMLDVTAVDIQPQMIKIAKNKYGGIANLNFVLGNANKPYGKNADAVIMATVLHEVYSYNNDSIPAVKQALQMAYKTLKQGGKIIIKDFARPKNDTQKVVLYHKKIDIKGKHSFKDFAKDFQSLNRIVPIKLLDNTNDFEIIETNMASAYDYIFRKDYTHNWKAEINEHYGFIKPSHLAHILEEIGFQVDLLHTFHNEWILENRIRGKVWLKDAKTGKTIPIPEYDMVIVAHK